VIPQADHQKIEDRPIPMFIYSSATSDDAYLNSKEEDTVIINEILLRAGSDPGAIQKSVSKTAF
jgi:hypothetical protein